MKDEEQKTVPQKEEAILALWRTKDIFQKSLDRATHSNAFVFYDGPPFGTGTPHYGHLLAGTLKDIIPRYKTMCGAYVRRNWGWDCHGLPVENIVEKELGLATKKDIEAFGIGPFNHVAKQTVLTYADEWKRIVPRSGRFVDMEHDYKTMNSSYTESVWWAFHTLYTKGRIYEGHKVMQLCPRCETTLSNFEVSQGYKDITDISAYALFALVDEERTYVVAWTTTPWTLPGNVALAVGQDFEYVKIEIEGSWYILAKERLHTVTQDYHIVDHHVQLVGRSYVPVFDYYYKNQSLAKRENGWKIYSAPFVTLDAGTGIVHIAPAFGDDDMALGKEYDLPFVQHVGTDGAFKDAFISGMQGVQVKPKDNHQATDIEIIKWMAHNGALFHKEKIVHSYPHCWRCATPLLNYASTSWFVQTTALKASLIDANASVAWVPEHIQEGRFGKWLENVRDWSISRSRFWGAPIPVWRSLVDGTLFVADSVDSLKSRTKKSGNTYYTVRHGEAMSNVHGVWDSGSDSANGLTEKGVAQVAEAGLFLKEKGIDIIVASPVLRTKMTAMHIAQTLGIDPLQIVYDDRLRELDPGPDFQGKPVVDFGAFFGTYAERYTKINPHGENYLDVRKRCMECLYTLEQQYTNKRILIVSHGSPIFNMIVGVQGTRLDMIEHALEDMHYPNNAEVQEIAFVPLPHNDAYELDLHRPYIDTYPILDATGQQMERVPEVFDCWFESGAMPFAQLHYPFENKELFEEQFPADFIAEGIDQTRGWFYSLLVLGVGIFDKAPYKHVLVNGIILAEDGKKMSKSLKNYPEVDVVLDKYGADALRLYVTSLPCVRGEESRFVEKDLAQLASRVLGRLRNMLALYVLYRDTNIETLQDGYETSDVLDQWIMSRMHVSQRIIQDALDRYHIDQAIREIDSMVDDLSTWYVRRSRDRIKDKDVSAQYTFYTVLKTYARVLAPFTPFVAEELWQALRHNGDVESVHLATWPEIGSIANYVIDQMKTAREYVTRGLEARQRQNIKVRQPLALLEVCGEPVDPEYVALIMDEVNVKKVTMTTELLQEVILDTTLTPALVHEGIVRECIRAIQDMRKVSGCVPEDVIQITIDGPSSLSEALAQDSALIQKVCGATAVIFVSVSNGALVMLGDQECRIAIERI